jgi:type I restriction enzyme, S subunit
MAGERPSFAVAELQKKRVLLVEDGNHGEYRPRPDEFVEEGVAFIRAADMEGGRVLFDSASKINESARQRITKGIGAPGDVLLSHKGTVGKVALVPDDAPDFVCSPQTTFWRTLDQDALDRKYLYAFLRSPGFHAQLATRAGETDMAPYVSLTSQRSLRVAVPPIETQRVVARILGTLDDKIELNRRMNQTLEAMARVIFKSWFVDFDPSRAKAAGRKLPGLAGPIADLFPDSFEDSELGEIPKGWKTRTLPEVVQINPTRTLTKGTVAPYLDMSNMPTQGPSPDAWIMREVGSGMKFINGDTLVARITPCLENGKTAFVNFLADNQTGWGSTEYIVLRPKGTIPPIFAYLLARWDDFRAFAIHQMTGSSGRQRVPAESLTKFKLAIPDIDSPLFAELGKLILPLFERIETASKESRTLAALRDALLPKLISGELRVSVSTEVESSQTLAATPATQTPAAKHGATDEFKEAILIAALVRALSDTNHPLGRKRYNKLAYMVHRKAEHDVQQKYLKKAAGPYSPWARYQGPEKIAAKNGYVAACKVGQLAGLVAGRNIGDIDKYLPRYGFADALAWVEATLRYEKNDELELLSTVDFAALDLLNRGQAVDAPAVKQVIAAHPDWAPKLDRAIFSDANITRALKRLKGCFPVTYP